MDIGPAGGAVLDQRRQPPLKRYLQVGHSAWRRTRDVGTGHGAGGEQGGDPSVNRLTYVLQNSLCPIIKID